MMNIRASGVLLHLTSLPSPWGVGDLGPAAYRFADFLARSGQAYWQMLPLVPTEPGRGDSPYNSSSAFAGNPLLISPELLRDRGLVTDAELAEAPQLPAGRVDYPAVHRFKAGLWERAFERAELGEPAFIRFRRANRHWLDDFCLFTALSGRHQGRTWDHWPAELRDRQPAALDQARRELVREIDLAAWLQFIFQEQLASLRRYCTRRGVALFGDLPIYVDYHSADVWAHPEVFQLGGQGRPRKVSGVPPDYFSATGQRWGNPVFDWERLRADGYQWWLERMARNLEIYDLVRIDHFRGLVAYWEIPAEEQTAVNGRWVEAPVMDFFRRLQRRFPSLPLVAEDLGLITPDVRETLCLLGLPGMKLFIFAFGEDNPRHPYLPHNFPVNCVAYTGTHDNNTMRGWWEEEADESARRRLADYLGRRVDRDNVAWESVRAVMRSVAATAVFPLQDLLGLGAEGRMNTPAGGQGNWGWRLEEGRLTPGLEQALWEMTRLYGRA
jgi:4-alpha-glucanotransferase